MHQRVIFVEADLTALRQGKIITLLGAEGRPPIEIGYEKAGPLSSNGRPGKPTTERQGLGALRGDCPYCASRDVLLSSHIHQKHRGKVIPYAGEGYQCPYCPQRYPTLQGTLRHIVKSHKGKKWKGLTLTKQPATKA
jgi:hypothetical protein